LERLLAPLRVLRAKLGTLWWHTFLMFCVCRLGDVVNLYIAMVLVPDVLQEAELGSVIPLTKLAVLIGTPLGIIGQTGRKYISVFLVAGDYGKIRRLLRDLGIISSIVSVAIVLVFLVCWPAIQERLKVTSHTHLTAILIAATAIVTCWLPMATMAAQGLKGFYKLTASQIVRPVVRLTVILVALAGLQVAGYLLANVLSMAFVLAFLVVGLVRHFPKGFASRDYRLHVPEMFRYTWPIAALVIVQSLQVAIEPWIVRQRLPLGDSAGYYIAVMFGDIPRWVAPAMLPFMFPLVSERFERGDSTRGLHLQSLGFVLLVGLGMSLFLFFFGEWLLNLRPAWAEYSAYAAFMCPLSVIATADVLFNTHITHENACRRFRYLRFYVPILLCDVGLLYGAMGWALFKKWLPIDIWNTVEAFIHRDLTFILTFMLVARLVLAAFVGLDVIRKRSRGV